MFQFPSYHYYLVCSTHLVLDAVIAQEIAETLCRRDGTALALCDKSAAGGQAPDEKLLYIRPWSVSLTMLS